MKEAALAPFAEAAAQNALLRNDLAWTFGSKQQQGWYLYDLLIGQTLNISHDASTNDFASAIAGWQKTKGLSPNGLLDENSLMAMLAQWQSNRLKDKTPATPDQLLMAPSSDFYDPERLPDAVVCYIDSTVALPLLTAYAMTKRKPRTIKSLYHRREELVRSMKKAAEKAGRLKESAGLA